MNNGNNRLNGTFATTLNALDFKIFNALCTNIQLPFFRLIKVVSAVKEFLPNGGKPIGTITARISLPARTINLPRPPIR